jgi:hypothetical protein
MVKQKIKVLYTVKKEDYIQCFYYKSRVVNIFTFSNNLKILLLEELVKTLTTFFIYNLKSFLFDFKEILHFSIIDVGW